MTPADTQANRPPDDDPFSDQLELLAVMGRDFASTLDINKTLYNALEHITIYMDAAGGALFLLEETGETLTCHVCVGDTEITGLSLKSDQGIVGRCVQNNKGEVVREAANDPSFNTSFDEITGYTTRSILCAPLSVKQQRIGAIELINRKGGDGLFSASDLTMLEALSSSAALAILNARMAESLVEQERIQKEIELAAEIQRSLLPAPQDDSYPIHGINIPARLVSGDFYDFFPLEDGRICFALGDVSGKGMNAALLMAKTASLYRCLGKTVHSPGLLLSIVNSEICETVTRGMFVTMVGGIFDPVTGVIRLANAGHEPPLICDGDGDFISLPAEAPPLGIGTDLVPGGIYPEKELSLDGGSFYIFTDGVTEGTLRDGEALGIEKLKKMICEYSSIPIKERLKSIVAPLILEDGELRDDITVIAIDDLGRDEPAGAQDILSGTEPNQRKDKDEDLDDILMSMTIPARANRLRAVRTTVSEAARLSGCSPEIAQCLVIAVDEALQNIVRHAYGADSEGDIFIEIHRDDTSITIFIRDYADAIDLSKVKPRDLNDLRPGGLGTHFIREVMDVVEFTSPPDGKGNLLRLVKHID